MNEISFEKIEQYLNGELSREEQLAFESELRTNEELASLMKLYGTIDTEMRNNETYSKNETELKKSLEKLNKIYFQKETNSNEPLSEANNEILYIESAEKNNRSEGIRLWKRLVIAAAIIGIVATGVVMYLNNKKSPSQVVLNNKKTDTLRKPKTDTIQLPQTMPAIPNLAKEDKNKTKPKKSPKINNINQEELYADNFKPDVVPEDKTGPLEDAFNFYEKGNYKDAIASIETADPDMIIRGQETDTKHIVFYTHYYKALSYMAIGNSVKAIPALKTAINKSPENSLQIKAQWYLALAYLKTNDFKNAKELLNQIASNSKEAEYKSKAVTLMTELKKRIKR